MKALFFLLFVTSFSFTFAQNIGDYGSKNTTGDWNAPSSWQVYNSSGWVDASSVPSSTLTSSPTLADIYKGSVTTATSHTLSLVSSGKTVSAGDLLIVFWGDHQKDNILFTTPTGWTNIYNREYHSQHKAVAFYKIAVGGETTLSLTTGDTDDQGVYIVYRLKAGSFSSLPVCTLRRNQKD